MRNAIKTLSLVMPVVVVIFSTTLMVNGQVLLAPAAPAVTEASVLDIVREYILKAQPEGTRVRIPLNSSQVQTLRNSLAARGVALTAQETTAAVDVASAYLREAASPQAFNAKVLGGMELRPGFHGNVAEFAEARARNMVLTKDIQSTTWDLTELTPRPRNLQVKVYQNGAEGVQSAIDDVRQVASQMKHGRADAAVPQESLDKAFAKGLLRRHGEFYAPVTGENITLMPMKTFGTAAESQVYAAEGQRVLGRLALSSRQPAANVSNSASISSLRVVPRMASPSSVAVVVQDGTQGLKLLNALKSPMLLAGGATLAIDGGIAVYKYIDGQTNKAELANDITDAAVRAVAVGASVQIVYLLAATPQGLVVAGVAILTYVAADALISYVRKEYGERYVRVEDLKGIAPSDFLGNLPRTLDQVAKTTASTAKPVLEDVASRRLSWER